MGHEECVRLGTRHLLEGAWQHVGMAVRCCRLECILGADHNDGHVLNLVGWAVARLNYLDKKSWSLDGRLDLVKTFPE